MRQLHALPIILTAAAMLAACGGGGSSGGGQGTVSVSMTDAPACGYDAVNVTVSKVRIHSSSDATGNEGGWTDITLNPARKINLLDLTNGALQGLGQATLPAGHYTQLRLVLDPNNGNSTANSVVLSGTTAEIPLDTPSAAQSGIKLVGSFDVAAGQQSDIVLDFDACKSVVTKGTGAYALKPVVKVIPTTLNGIDGYVNTTVLAEHVMVTAQQNGEVVSATVPDPATGKFFLARLVPGNYDVVITADNRATAVIAAVPVVSPTSKVSLSTSTAPFNLLPAATPPAAITGTVSTTPTNTSDEAAYVTARQSFAAGPTVTVKYRGVDVANGSYTLDKLPTVAPQLGQYSATLPIALTTQTNTTPGTGKYAVTASLTGYVPQTATVDVSAADAVQNFALTK